MIGTTLDRMSALFDRRFVSRPSWAVLIELFVGVGWLRAGFAKAVERDWWTGHTIVDFVREHEQVTIGWYRPVLDRLVVDSAVAWAVVIFAAEIAIGISLLTTRRMGAGLSAAIFLNVNFLLVGAPNPSIFYLILQLSLALWLLEMAVPRPASIRWLRILAISGGAVVVGCLPYVRSVHPHAVIEDPAAVLVTWAACAAIACVAARRRVRRMHLQLA